ncbi:hypothetical protein [Alicyclobacillus suci]|uniref:hypothetical protein n=1 Tax=Alicyclobacillus suci TaxID=2816080 RepID=UPI001A8FBCFE|nr:hypothetical protein [Alicyclobacillus suci]
MRSPLLLSAGLVTTLVSSVFSVHIVQADASWQGFPQHTHTSRSNADIQPSHSHRETGMGPSHQVPGGSTKKPVTDLNQIVTQFQQAIAQYAQDSHSHQNVTNPEASGHSRASGRLGSSRGATTPDKGNFSGNHSGIRSESQTNTSVAVGPSNRSHAVTQAKSSDTSKQSQTLSKRTGIYAGKSQSSATSAKDDTADKLATQLNNYAKATALDEKQQANLKQSLHTYTSALGVALAKRPTPKLTTAETSVANALALLQSALHLQSDIGTAQTTLQTKARQKDKAAMLTILTEMTENETQKAEDLARAATMLSHAASDLM